MDYLEEKGAKKISILYNATFPTFALLGEEDVPAMAKERGMEVVQSLSVQMTTQDFTGQAQQIAREGSRRPGHAPDRPAVGHRAGPARGRGLRRPGRRTSVQAAGNIKAAGDSANGLVYPVPFSVAMEGESSKAFTEAFKKKFDKEPNPYAADGYDAMWWIARAIKASGDSSREGIRKGLAEVAGEGFTGAMGDLTFDGNDARIEGALVQWNNGKESLAAGDPVCGTAHVTSVRAGPHPTPPALSREEPPCKIC